LTGLLGIVQPVVGQTDEIPEGYIAGHMDPGVLGVEGKIIYGSRGFRGLPYAHVFFIDEEKRDTVKLACDVLGLFHWKTSRLPARLKIRVTAVGFKTFEGEYVPTKNGNYINIRLLQKEQELNEVIITAKKVYMVVKGDTLEYKAEAFKTLDGDVVTDLLKKLPGVSTEDGQISVNGEPISIIRVDGKDFDPSLRSALLNIRADNIKSIQVHNERNKQDQAAGMKYGRREKVMNLVTKRGVNPFEIRNNWFLFGTGVDVSRDRTTHFKEKWNLGFNYKVPLKPTKEDFKRNLRMEGEYKNVGAGEEVQKSSFRLQYHNMDNLDLRKAPHKLRYSTESKFNNTTKYSSSFNERVYFPTADYDSRTYESLSSGKNSRYSYSTSHQIYWRKFTGAVKYEGNDTRDTRSSRERAEMDGLLLSSADSRRRAKSHFSRGSGQFSLGLPKGLSLSSSFSLGGGRDEAWQVDTLPESNRHVHLTQEYDGRVAGWGGGIQFHKTYSLYRVNLGYSYDASMERQEGQSVDRLTGLLDTNGTRDFSFYRQTHRLSGGLSFYNQKVSLNATLKMEHLLRNHVERFPTREQHRDHFLVAWADIQVNKYCSPELNWQVKYTLTPLLPAVGQLRTVIRDENPLFLSTGNPSLKPAKIHSLNVMVNKMFVSRASQLGFSLLYTLTQDFITSYQRYFAESTYLPEYDYTAIAGATLTVPKNTKPSHDLQVQAKYSKYSGLLESKLEFELLYNYEKSPSFLQGERNDLVTDKGTFKWNITSGFSRQVELVLGSSTSLSSTRSDLDKASNILNEWADFTVRTKLIPKFTVIGTFSYIYKKNYATEREYNQTNLRAEISRNLGKFATIKLEGINLLDRQTGVNFTKTADYTARGETARTGRYVLLTLTQKLR